MDYTVTLSQFKGKTSTSDLRGTGPGGGQRPAASRRRRSIYISPAIPFPLVTHTSPERKEINRQGCQERRAEAKFTAEAARPLSDQREREIQKKCKVIGGGAAPAGSGKWNYDVNHFPAAVGRRALAAQTSQLPPRRNQQKKQAAPIEAVCLHSNIGGASKPDLPVR